MGAQETGTGTAENEGAKTAAEKTEIPGERTAGSTSWQLADGKKEVVYYLGPVRFEDENGELVDYDPSLQAIREEDIPARETLSGYAYKNTAGEKTQYFPEKLDGDTPLRMENGAYLLEASPYQPGEGPDRENAEDTDENGASGTAEDEPADVTDYDAEGIIEDESVNTAEDKANEAPEDLSAEETEEQPDAIENSLRKVTTEASEITDLYGETYFIRMIIGRGKAGCLVFKFSRTFSL